MTEWKQRLRQWSAWIGGDGPPPGGHSPVVLGASVAVVALIVVGIALFSGQGSPSTSQPSVVGSATGSGSGVQTIPPATNGTAAGSTTGTTVTNGAPSTTTTRPLSAKTVARRTERVNAQTARAKAKAAAAAKAKAAAHTKTKTHAKAKAKAKTKVKARAKTKTKTT